MALSGVHCLGEYQEFHSDSDCGEHEGGRQVKEKAGMEEKL